MVHLYYPAWGPKQARSHRSGVDDELIWTGSGGLKSGVKECKKTFTYVKALLEADKNNLSFRQKIR